MKKHILLTLLALNQQLNLVAAPKAISKTNSNLKAEALTGTARNSSRIWTVNTNEPVITPVPQEILAKLGQCLTEIDGALTLIPVILQKQFAYQDRAAKELLAPINVIFKNNYIRQLNLTKLLNDLNKAMPIIEAFFTSAAQNPKVDRATQSQLEVCAPKLKRNFNTLQQLQDRLTLLKESEPLLNEELLALNTQCNFKISYLSKMPHVIECHINNHQAQKLIINVANTFHPFMLNEKAKLKAKTLVQELKFTKMLETYGSKLDGKIYAFFHILEKRDASLTLEANASHSFQPIALINIAEIITVFCPLVEAMIYALDVFKIDDCSLNVFELRQSYQALLEFLTSHEACRELIHTRRKTQLPPQFRSELDSNPCYLLQTHDLKKLHELQEELQLIEIEEEEDAQRNQIDREQAFVANRIQASILNKIPPKNECDILTEIESADRAQIIQEAHQDLLLIITNYTRKDTLLRNAQKLNARLNRLQQNAQEEEDGLKQEEQVEWMKIVENHTLSFPDLQNQAILLQRAFNKLLENEEAVLTPEEEMALARHTFWLYKNKKNVSLIPETPLAAQTDTPNSPKWNINVPASNNYFQTPPHIQQQIIAAIKEQLSTNAYAGKVLHKELSHYCSLRLGNYRAIYKIDLQKQAIYILLIAYRSMVYEKAQRALT